MLQPITQRCWQRINGNQDDPASLTFVYKIKPLGAIVQEKKNGSRLFTAAAVALFFIRREEN
jgi:hypothetical protein